MVFTQSGLSILVVEFVNKFKAKNQINKNTNQTKIIAHEKTRNSDISGNTDLNGQHTCIVHTAGTLLTLTLKRKKDDSYASILKGSP